MRLLRRIIWPLFLLLWLGAVVLWARSYWQSDDVFLSYDGDGSAYLRIRRGMVSVTHVSARQTRNPHAFNLVRIVTTGNESQPPEIAASQTYETHKRWLNFRFDSITSAQIAGIQAAHAAKIGNINQAAWAARQASYAAVRKFEDAAPNYTSDREEREDFRIAYWQMRAAQEHVAATRAVQLQMAAIPVPSLRPQWQVIFPFWSVWAIAAVPLALPLLKVIAKRRRIRHGLCGHCGYNLHGNTSGICPECGVLAGVVLCRSVTVEGRRVLSIRSAAIGAA